MVAHANLHFILDAALPFLRVTPPSPCFAEFCPKIQLNLFHNNLSSLQTFFSKFYSIDKDLHPTEQEHVNSLTSVLLVRTLGAGNLPSSFSGVSVPLDFRK